MVLLLFLYFLKVGGFQPLLVVSLWQFRLVVLLWMEDFGIWNYLLWHNSFNCQYESRTMVHDTSFTRQYLSRTKAATWQLYLAVRKQYQARYIAVLRTIFRQLHGSYTRQYLSSTKAATWQLSVPRPLRDSYIRQYLSSTKPATWQLSVPSPLNAAFCTKAATWQLYPPVP